MIENKIEEYLKENKIEYNTNYITVSIPFSLEINEENLQPLYWLVEIKKVISPHGFKESLSKLALQDKGWEFITITTDYEIKDKLSKLNGQ